MWMKGVLLMWTRMRRGWEMRLQMVVRTPRASCDTRAGK